MLEWRPTAVSRARIAVMLGSHGACVWYMPNCTAQGATAALAECDGSPTRDPTKDSPRAATTDATRRRKPTRFIGPPAHRPLHSRLQAAWSMESTALNAAGARKPAVRSVLGPGS